MNQLRRAIGVISGTSMDAIDVALIETDGREQVRPLGGAAYPYPDAVRVALFDLLKHPERAETEAFAALEAAVTDAHVAAVQAFMARDGVVRGRIDVVGLHGQTVWHRPERRFTRQLLDGQRAVAALGRDVVFRFRHADVAAGGQGAPFVPLYHRALVAALPQPVMVLNLGGVANVTYVDGETVIAFDTGPASALIDDLMQSRAGVPFDDGGRVAASGRADRGMVAALMDNPYFAAPPPKSLDRNDFARRARIIEALPLANAAATLAAFTVESVAAALNHVPRAPSRWLVAGGGRLNAHLMATLGERVGVPVDPVEAVGWNGDLTEAECFAYLAVRTLEGLPLSLPTTTGVPAPMTGGEVVRA